MYGPSNFAIEQINISTGTVSYLHHDQAGSTRLITGSTGTITGKCTYSPYGTPTCEGTSTTPLGFDGQYTSSDTGLIYMRNRVYDPSTAQFLTVDPAASVTRAPYNYAGDNPVNERDRTGLAEETIDCYPWGCFSSPGGSGNNGGEVVGETIAKNWHEFEGGAEKIGEEVGNIWNEVTSSGGNPQGGHRSGDLPGKSEPGSTGVTEKAPGVGTIREYGPDGWAETDYDFGHNHPPGCPGDPHAHDFEENLETGRLERGPGRPLGPGE